MLYAPWRHTLPQISRLASVQLSFLALAPVLPCPLMDPFVRRLVERLFDPSHPLSRNRHFHTFENAEGRQALRIWKRLNGLRADLQACVASGIETSQNAEGEVVIVLRVERLRSTRTTRLDASEFELLCRLPGVKELLLARA